MNHMPVSVALVKLPAVKAVMAGSKAGRGPAIAEAAATRRVKMAQSHRIDRDIVERPGSAVGSSRGRDE